MGTISVSLPSDGSTADVSDYNTPINTIVNEINGNISNANIKSDAAIAGTKIADGAITNAKLSTTAGELGGAWADWTPTWANLTVGNSTVTAKYTQIGKTVFGKIMLDLGSTGSIGNSITFSLPVTATTTTTSFDPIGLAITLDFGTEALQGVVYLNSSSATVANIRWLSDASTATNAVSVQSTFPFTETTTDQISLNFTYEAA